MGEGALLALGNLLLDMIVVVPEDLLKKYNLEPDSTTLADEKTIPLFDEICNGNFQVEFIPGGSSANTIRVAQWILKSLKSTTFVGAVGDDSQSDRLSSLLEEEGIKLACQKIPSSSTGRCAVMITGHKRTLLTQLGAAMMFNFEEFMKSGHCELEKARVVYISGYFLRVCSKTAMEVASVMSSKNYPVVLNLNAVWITNVCNKELQDILPYVDYLIGNSSEAIAYANKCGAGVENLIEISKWFAQLPTKKLKGPGGRVVLITRGEEPIIVATDSKVTEYPIYEVPMDKIIDTNGAGDAFAGGFLAGLVQQKSLESCISFGLSAAAEIVQQVGCTFPKDKTLLVLKQ